MAELLETALYNALLELREAETAYQDAKFAMAIIRMKRKRKGKGEAFDAVFDTAKKLGEAQDAADELLARIANVKQQVAEQFEARPDPDPDYEAIGESIRERFSVSFAKLAKS